MDGYVIEGLTVKGDSNRLWRLDGMKIKFYKPESFKKGENA